VNQPGPLRAFYQRIKARRGQGKAIVAAGRKLAVLFWCLLHRSFFARERERTATMITDPPLRRRPTAPSDR
jgi:hypothetical protein